MRKWILIQLLRRKQLRGIGLRLSRLQLMPSLGDLVEDGRVDLS